MTSPDRPHTEPVAGHGHSAPQDAALREAAPRDAAPSTGHETRDVNIRAILWLAGGVAISAIVIHAGLWFLLEYYNVAAERSDPRLSPLADKQRVPPSPNLQSEPNLDYATFRDSQQQILKSYGWIDRQQGVVRIPVSRAMELLVERGLPTPSGPVEPAEAQPESPEAKPESTEAKPESTETQPDAASARTTEPQEPPAP